MRHPYYSRLFILCVMLLCSCITERKAKKYFDENPEELAVYVDENPVYKEEYGGAYAAKNFPREVYAPAIEPKVVFMPGRLTPYPLAEQQNAGDFRPTVMRCPACSELQTTKTVYLEDTSKLEALRVMLDNERTAYDDVTQQLKKTEAERDYWQEQNEKKLWALIAMAVFAALYIIFKVLASRVREA